MNGLSSPHQRPVHVNYNNTPLKPQATSFALLPEIKLFKITNLWLYFKKIISVKGSLAAYKVLFVHHVSYLSLIGHGKSLDVSF